MRVLAVLLFAACGGTDPAVSAMPAPAARVVMPVIAPDPPTCGAGVPAEACRAGVRACAADAAERSGEWRYAIVGGLFEPVVDLAFDRVVLAWRAGKLAASADTQAALEPILGPSSSVPRIAAGARPPVETSWAIVPAHELVPAWKVITVGRHHPLAPEPDRLAVALCGAPVRNIDPAKLTRLVMSGTTALTRRVAERVAATGAVDTVKRVKPWFANADLVHISNEVSFVKDCDPATGPTELSFCSRERDIAVLEAVNTNIVELTGSHLTDYGSDWLVHTIGMYKQRGWVWFGGGRTQIEATEPRIVEHNGNRLAFLGCNAVGTWLRGVSPRVGVAACDWAKMTWQVHDLRRRGLVPIVTVQHQEVLVHDPPAGLVRDLRRFAIAGAAFVLGSQAHSAHPWDVHHGAFVHYGPGNLLFAQDARTLLDAATDKLYLHAGRLLAVEQMYSRVEHGQPRPLTDKERVRFLAEMAGAARKLVLPEPWQVPVLPDDTRARPDSLVVQGKLQKLVVTVPAAFDAAAKNAAANNPAAKHPLVVDLVGASVGESSDAFVVTPTGKLRATAAEIVAYMRAKYPIDGKRTRIVKPLRKRR